MNNSKLVMLRLLPFCLLVSLAGELQAVPEEAIRWNNSGVEAIKKEDFKEAERCLLASLKIKPNYGTAIANLAICYNNQGMKLQGKPLAAAVLFRRSLYLNPGDATPRSNLNTVLSEVGCNPTSIEHRVRLADKLVAQKDYVGAIVEYGAALAMVHDQGIKAKLAAVPCPVGLPDMRKLKIDTANSVDAKSKPSVYSDLKADIVKRLQPIWVAPAKQPSKPAIVLVNLYSTGRTANQVLSDSSGDPVFDKICLEALKKITYAKSPPAGSADPMTIAVWFQDKLAPRCVHIVLEEDLGPFTKHVDDIVNRMWHPEELAINAEPLEAKVEFSISRKGAVSDIKIQESSHSVPFDQAVVSFIQKLGKLEGLPPGCPNSIRMNYKISTFPARETVIKADKLLSEKKFAESLAAYQKALRGAAPLEKPAIISQIQQVARNQARTLSNSPNEAIPYFEQAIVLNPSDTGLMEDFNKLLIAGKFDPSDPEVRMRLAEDACAREDFESAKFELKQAMLIRSGPSISKRLDEITALAIAKQEVEVWQAKAEKSPSSSEPHLKLGELLEKLNRKDQALAEYKKAADLDPTNQTAKAKISEIEAYLLDHNSTGREPSRTLPGPQPVAGASHDPPEPKTLQERARSLAESAPQPIRPKPSSIPPLAVEPSGENILALSTSSLTLAKDDNGSQQTSVEQSRQTNLQASVEPSGVPKLVQDGQTPISQSTGPSPIPISIPSVPNSAPEPVRSNGKQAQTSGWSSGPIPSMSPIQSQPASESELHSPNIGRYLELAENQVLNGLQVPKNVENGLVSLPFKIERDGTVIPPATFNEPGKPILSAAALTTLRKIRKLPPIPADLQAPLEFSFLYGKGLDRISFTLTTGDFGPYMVDMQRRLKNKWFPPRHVSSYRLNVKFTVRRDGTVSNIAIAKSSGLPAADTAGLEAVRNSAPLRPLPTGAPKVVDINFNFDYSNSSAQQAAGASNQGAAAELDRAKASYTGRQFSQAVKEFAMLVQKYPNDQNVHYYLGLSCLESGMQDKAKAEFEWVVKNGTDKSLTEYAQKVLVHLRTKNDSRPRN